jgi:threonine dehydrogenase-like Zn-dependent dehydrogenase
LPVNIFIQHEISLDGSQGYLWDFQDGLRLLSLGSIDLKPLITHRISLQNLQQGFEILMNPKIESIKVVIQIND